MSRPVNETSTISHGIGPALRTDGPRAPPLGMVGRYVYDVEPVDGALAWRLFEACRDGDEDEAAALLAAAPALVHAQYWYTQPIHFAVYANRPAVVHRLLEAGAEPGRTRFMDSGWNKLLRCARLLGFDEVESLLAETARRRFGYDPEFALLGDAVASRSRERVDDVLKERPRLARASDVQGRNAVHWAVMTRQPGLIPLLVQAGADPRHQRSDGQKPAHVLFNGDYEYRPSRELAGVDAAPPNEVLEALVLAGVGKDVSAACAVGDLGLVRALLADEPGLVLQLDSGRRSLLGYAARGGHLHLVEFLLQSGARPNQPEELAPRGHALWHACAAGRTDIAQLLLEHGADPNSAPDSSDSCLGIARRRRGKGGRKLERLLLAHGAETPAWHMSNQDLARVLAADGRAPTAARRVAGNRHVASDPWFPVEVLARNDLTLANLLLAKDPGAARRLDGATLRTGDPDKAVSSPAVLQRLLGAGLDPNRRGWLGQTALHHYAGRGETANAALLLRHGAVADVLDDEHHGTPLAWAAAAGHYETVELLLARGADPALPLDLPAATPLTRARRRGHRRVAALLQRRRAG